MKALSFWQPWAWLVIAGAKQYETRGWSTKVRGPILIHASLSMRGQWHVNHEPFRAALARHPILHSAALAHTRLALVAPYHAVLDRGCIIGQVDLVDCQKIISTDSTTAHLSPGLLSPAALISGDERQFGDYHLDHFAWRLENPRICRPVAVVGQHKLFSVAEAMREQLIWEP
jgi:hypothetical protein